jgi:hypothetical protein
MKTLLKVALVFFVIVGLLLGAAIFVLTRPGVQTSLIEKRLPPGSSLRSVQVTTGSLSLSELKLALPDGTVLRVDRLETDFKPLAAVFDRTVRMGAVQLQGVVVDLQAPLIAFETKRRAPTTPRPAASGEAVKEAPSTAVTPAPAQTTGSPLDTVYALGQLDWLLDIGSVSIDGEVRDPAGSVFALQLRSDAIRPGASANMEASLGLRSAQELPAGLQEFEASARVQLMQNEGGGFEQVAFESVASSSDAAGNKLLSLSQNFELNVQSFDETASLRAELRADLPQPDIFLPELSDLPGLGIEAAFRGSAKGRQLTLSEASFAASSAGQPVAELDLKQSFKIGSREQLTGDLMDFRLTRMPLAWVTPWLPEGLAVTGEPLTMAIRFTGETDGRLLLESTGPLEIGPLSVLQGGAPLLQDVTLTAAPRLRMSEDQSFVWDLGEFRLMDRYGELVTGQSTGRLDAGIDMADTALPAGLQTSTRFDLGLLELSQQPMFANRFSLLTGRGQAALRLDPGAEYPYALQGAIRGLSSRDQPGLRQDYRFAVQLKESQPEVLALGLNLEAGADSRPSTSVQVAGQFRPGSEPRAFQVDLTSPRMSQQDLMLLASAFSPGETAVDRQQPAVVSDQVNAPLQPSGSTARRPSAGVEPPPWSGLKGNFSAEIDAFVLNSGRTVEAVEARGRVSGALLALSELQARLEDGRIEGQARAEFAAQDEAPYRIGGEFRLRSLDPSLFADRRAGTFPVQGLFDGDLSFNGRGQSLEHAADGVQGELTVTGREGVLTAFELDQRSQLGLIGAGLLGQRFERPGISAMAQAVPYFENMPFEHFELKLSRGADKNILVPKLQFKGDNVLIDGSGFIAATNLEGLLDQPLDLSLEFGAKGKLVKYLETLQLLGADIGEDGFRRWSKAIEIGGTLGNPDTSALKRVLRQAAKQALSQPRETEQEVDAAETDATETDTSGTGGEEAQPAPKKSKEQKLRDDVETGLDLLNTVLGG